MNFLPMRSSLSKADQIYEQLRGGLLAGDYEFGEVLSTYELAQQFGVSRRPVMDAVMRLEAAGFISIIRQVGCQVVIPDARIVREHFAVAGVLEGAGARLAASQASEADLATIEAAHERSAAPLEANDVVGFAETNRQFHAAVLLASGNRRLAELAQQAWDLSDFYLRARPSANLGTAHAEHGEILSALKRRDADVSRELMETHLSRFWSEVGLPGVPASDSASSSKSSA